jgi:ribose 5-phosphate isomerase B
VRIHLATDHAGFELKNALASHLQTLGHEVIDHGAWAYDPDDDYPPFCFAAGQAVVSQPGSLGIVIGGSGNGEQIAANKVRGVRAALAWNVETARLARRHNDANVIGLGARQLTTEQAIAIVEAFISEPFQDEDRHSRRIAALKQYEQQCAQRDDSGTPAHCCTETV